MAPRKTGRRKRRRGVEPNECLLSPHQEKAALLLWRNTNLPLEAIGERLGVSASVISRLSLREL